MKNSHIVPLMVLCMIVSTTIMGQSWLKPPRANEDQFEKFRARVSDEVFADTTVLGRRNAKKFKRWENMMESHLATDGTRFNYVAQNVKAHQQAKTMASNQADGRSRYGQWETVSPADFSPVAPFNGRINAMAIHPTNPNVIYIGAVYGGLWKTINQGATWVALTDGLPIIAISDIEIDHQNPNTIYILTGDGDGKHVPSVGILKSVDGGLNWAETDMKYSMSSENYGFNIAMDPYDSQHMLVTTTAGILETFDGWLNADPVQGGNWRDVEFKHGSSDTIFGTSASVPYMSTNGGSSFTPMNGVGGLPVSANFERLGVGLTEADPNSVYYIYTNDSNGGFKGLYYSSDGGSSFTMQSDTPNITGPWAWWDLDILVDNQDPSIVYVSGLALYKSTDYGVTWTRIANGNGLPSVHADIHRIVQRGNTLYTCSDGGISKSTNAGASWSDISKGLNIMQFFDIAVDGNRIMGGTQDNGSMLWNESDASGDSILGGDGFECMFDPSNANVIYASTQVTREKSTDGGASFNDITPFGDYNHWHAPWIMHPTNPDTQFATFANIYRTFDGGNSWFNMDTNATPGAVKGIVMAPSNPGIMYVLKEHSVRKTSNAMSLAPSFTTVTNELASTTHLRGITIDDNDPSKVFVSYVGYNPVRKVYVTYNGGAEWEDYTGSLPNVTVQCLLFETGSEVDGIYAGTDIGVFYRNNNIGDWIYYSNGLPTTQVRDLHIENGQLYAGTLGRGIWKSELYNTCPVSSNLSHTNDPSSLNSTGVQTYEASFAIVSTRTITGGIGTDVRYQAGTYVRLDPGFRARALSQFEAKIDGCTEN